MDTPLATAARSALTDAATTDMRAARRRFYDEIARLHLTPLWEVLHALVPTAPATPCAPAHWRYADVHPHLMRAGEHDEVVVLDGAAGEVAEDKRHGGDEQRRVGRVPSFASHASVPCPDQPHDIARADKHTDVAGHAHGHPCQMVSPHDPARTVGDGTNQGDPPCPGAVRAR